VKLKPDLKAVTGGLAGGAAALYPALGGGVTGAEWLAAVVAAVLTATGVWAVPNRGTGAP
jgi:hypothetical protein